MLDFKAETQPDVKISNYELNKYSYSNFWQGREYEHQSEILAINKLMNHQQGDWFLDIGGAYGRLLKHYHTQFHHSIILDYSTRELAQASKKIKAKEMANVHLLAANLYKMPLADQSIDAGMMVRVLHHVEDVDLFLKELNRVLKPGAKFILEFANKRNLRAILRAILHLDLRFFFSGVYKQPVRDTSQGIDCSKEQISLVYNFNYGYIRSALKRNGFKMRQHIAVSFFRIPFLKRIIPLKLLLIIERLAQLLFGWTSLTPSIFLLVEKVSTGERKLIDAANYPSFESFFVCPLSKEKMDRQGSDFVCASCHKKYSQTLGIWDFREPKPEEVQY